MEDPFSVNIACYLLAGTATFNIETTNDDVASLVKPAALLSSSTLLTFDPAGFASAYAQMAVGRPVADLTPPQTQIAAGRTVASFTTNTVTLSAAAASVAAGDLISFLTWFVLAAPFTGATGNVTGAITGPVRGISINQTLGTGTVMATFVQAQLPK
jgi:hypothetical protein